MRRRDFLIGLGLAAGSLAGRAQPAARPHHIVVITPPVGIARLASGFRGRDQAFYDRLRELGRVEGQNLVVERYTVEGQGERRQEPVREAVGKSPDVIVVVSSPDVGAVARATSTIPVVYTGPDSVRYAPAPGGGNMTGVRVAETGPEVWSKRLELLKQAVPAAATVAYLGHRAIWETHDKALLQAGGSQIGIALREALFDLGIPPQIASTLAALEPSLPDGLVVSEWFTNYINRRLIVEFAQQHRLPAMFPWREGVELGGLMSYELDGADVARRLADIVDRILKGAKPGDIPVYGEAKYELGINRKAAQSLGLTLPPALLAGADHVIE